MEINKQVFVKGVVSKDGHEANHKIARAFGYSQISGKLGILLIGIVAITTFLISEPQSDFTIFIVWISMLSTLIFAFIYNYMNHRIIQRPRSWKYFHKKLLQKGAVEESDTQSTLSFLDELCDTGLALCRPNVSFVSCFVGFRFAHYMKDRERYYSMTFENEYNDFIFGED